MFIAITDNKVLSIVITVFISIGLVFLSYLLIKSIINEIRKDREEKDTRLDGVLNKAQIESSIATYIAQIGSNGQFGLIYIDLDKFTNFTSIFTEKEVRTILNEIVKKLKRNLPTDVKIARYKGDEFLILFSNKYKREDVNRFASILLEQFRMPIKIFDNTLLDQTASISSAFYPNHGSNVSDLIKSLKLVNYQIKKNGGNSTLTYSNTLKNLDDESVDYYYQIKEAIELKQFTLYYQPIMDLNNNEIYAAEALLRWNHPSLGLLSPDKFIPIMEQSGDIYWVGLWGLEKAIQVYYDWKDLGYENIKPSINISLKQLMYEELSTEFQKLCRKYKMNPGNIILEIEEIAIYDKSSVIYNNILRLKNIGFKIAIDGFGIDFNALEHIEKLNINAIKFKYNTLVEKKSFAAQKLFETLLEFVKNRKMLLFVQDIESELMIENIKDLNFQYGQGYYFSKVLSEDEMVEILQNKSN